MKINLIMASITALIFALIAVYFRQEWISFFGQFTLLKSTSFFRFAVSSQGVYFVCLGFGVVMGIILYICSFIGSPQQRTSHGSARWGTAKDFDLHSSDGWALGRLDGKMMHANTHVLTVAPTGSGKGVGGMIPTLLTYSGSIVCLDIKGENYAVTKRRRKELGSNVILLDPFGVTGEKSNTHNWLDKIDLTQDDCVDQAKAIVSCMLHGMAEQSKDGHWIERASHLLTCIILYCRSSIVADFCQNLNRLHTVMSLPTQDFVKFLKELSMTYPEKEEENFATIRQIVATFIGNAEGEFASILSSANRGIAFLTSKKIQRNIEESDFSFDELKSGNQTIYIVLPPDRLHDYKVYARTIFTLALATMTASQEPPKAGPVLFLMDEFPQLQRMEKFEQGISLLRGYGVRLWLFCQDLSQLHNIYGNAAPTFLANSTLLVYGCSDTHTAHEISDRLGKFTETIYNEKTGLPSYIGRPLMTESEVLTLPSSSAIAFLQGKPPIRLQRLNYLKDREYKNLYDPNPYY